MRGNLISKNRDCHGRSPADDSRKSTRWREHAEVPRGFTILELTIATAIFLVATVVIAAYITQGYRANRFALEQADAIDHARKGIDTMVKEIREAAFSDLGNYPIVSALDQSFIFYSDLDADLAVERIRYYLNGSDFMKGVIEPVGNPPSYPLGSEQLRVLSQYVRNGVTPILYYYSGDYPSTTVPIATPADPNKVRLIELRLHVNVDPTRAPQDILLRTFVQPRTVKDNL
mgnify:CR=1 FL=1